MRHLKKYTLFLAILVMAYNTHAQEANKTSFSLQEAIDYSLKHSPNYLNAELDYQSADYRRKEITGAGLPQINGSIDFKDYINIATSLLPAQIFGGPEGTFLPVKFGTKYNATAGLSASQLIFSSDYIFGLKAQKEFMNLSKISITRSKADLVSQVTKAYYTVLISRDRIKSLESNITKLKKTYEDTKAINQQGLMFELIDVERLEVSYNNLLTEKEKTERLIGLAELTLKFQMGYKLEDPLTLSDSLNIESNFQEMNASKTDVSLRPDYQLLQSQQKLLDLDVKAKKYVFLPTLSAYGSYQYNAQRNEFNFFESSNGDPSKKWFKVSLIGATLNFNVFTGWQRMNRLEQAKIASLKNQNTMKNLELAAQLETNSASVNYTNAYSSLVRQKKNVELAQHVYEVARKKYESGVGSNIEVVNAETDLTSAQTNYYNAIFDMIVAKTDYLKATGTLVK